MTIETPPELDIAIDDDGLARCNVSIDYTISPAEYTAVSANIYIYEQNDGQDVLVANLPVETRGTGFGTIASGFRFNADSQYYARVVLNSGSEVQIESEPIKLNPGFRKIKSITIEDLELHQSILPSQTVTFRAESEPAGIAVRWSVMTPHPDVKVSIKEATGQLTVDPLSEDGWAIVRATDPDNDCVYRQVRVYIGCLSCAAGSGGSCYSSATYDLGSIDIKIGLGRTAYGSSSGCAQILFLSNFLRS